MSARIGIRYSGIWLVILVMVAAIGCARAASDADPRPRRQPAPAPPPRPPAPAVAGPRRADGVHERGAAAPRHPERRPLDAAVGGVPGHDDGIFALAQIRLDQALADRNWTAIIPKE